MAAHFSSANRHISMLSKGLENWSNGIYSFAGTSPGDEEESSIKGNYYNVFQKKYEKRTSECT
jgi:hypothetical protein